MNKYNEFLNEIKQLNIEVAEYCFLNGAGWVKSKDYPELPTGLKKKYRWNLTALKESELKMLQSSAINELALLSEDQMQMQLKRLDFINEFDRFFDFVKQFYVKFEKNNCTGLDISDFKMKLESCFYCEIPEKGNLDIDFLNELLNDLFIKSAIFDGLKYQLKQLAPSEPQQETKKKIKNPYPEIFPDVFSFMLFERLHKDYKDSNNLLADYSFIYRKLWELDHIVEYQKPEMFREWLSREPYEIILPSKFKTLDNCKTKSKEDNFKLTLDLMEKI